MDPAVSVQSLGVTYRRRLRSPEVRALDGLDLEVAPGEIIGVLGPNGSGKTTLLEVLAGSLTPTAGTVRVLSRPPTDRALVPRVGYQPQSALPFPALSAREFLAYLAALMRLPRDRSRRSADEWLERLDLARAGRRPIGTFSTGMGRRLALAAALLADPEVLLLDEPTSGIDPSGSLTVLEILEAKAHRGGTVIMTSHHLQEIEQTCHRVYLLKSGRCRAHGSLDELLGTGDRTLVVRGLDDDGVSSVGRAVTAAGGELLRTEPARRHLFELFRALDDEDAGAGDGH